MRENNPQRPPNENGAGLPGETYLDAGFARHICFQWPQGRQFFLNYSYLVLGEYIPEADVIALQFTSHSVQLTGVRSESLFRLIMHHSAKSVVCVDTHYDLLADDQQPQVRSIAITTED